MCVVAQHQAAGSSCGQGQLTTDRQHDISNVRASLPSYHFGKMACHILNPQRMFFDMDERRRNILERVAAGEIAPEEALALLGQGQPPASAPEQVGSSLRRVVIEADLGAVAIVADDTVDDAVAVGAHELRRIDGAVRITAPRDRSIISDGRLMPPRGRRHALRVRMRPDLALTVKLGTGSVHVEGLQAAADIGVDLGTVTLERVDHPFTVRVGSGSVAVSGRINQGESTINCDLGAITIRLDAASDVRVTAATDAGRITLPGTRNRPKIVFGTKTEAVVGRGHGHLDIATGAGSIAVKVEA